MCVHLGDIQVLVFIITSLAVGQGLSRVDNNCHSTLHTTYCVHPLALVETVLSQLC